MTVTLVAAAVGPATATAANPLTQVAPSPAGMANGNRVYVMATSEPSGTQPTLSANGTGWNLLYSTAPGSVRLSCWWRDKDASWSTMPTVSVAGGNATTNALIVGSAAFATDGTWVTPSSADYTTGADTTSATSFAATGGGTLAAAAGEYLFALCGTSGNSTMTAHSLTLPGATLTSPAELSDLGTSVGGGVGFKLIGAPVSAGPGTGAPTVSGTLSGANTGSVYFIRVRDTPAAGGGGSYPTIKQNAVPQTSTLTSNVQTATISAAVAGNLLVVCGSGDKNVGAFTVSDNIGNNGGANPWVEEMDVAGTQVTMVHAYKRAVGGETTITLTSTGNNSTGASSRVLELEQTGTGAWAVVAKSPVPTYSDTAVNARSTGTTGAATHNGLAIAHVAVDSVNSAGALYPASWSNSFTSAGNPPELSGAGGGNSGVFVATKNIDAGQTAEATATFNGGFVEQAMGFMVAYGRQNAGAVDTTKFFLGAAA